MLVPGTYLPPVTKAPITMQGTAFLPNGQRTILLLGAPEAQSAAMPPVAPMQSAAMLPMAGALLLSQCTPYPSAYMYMAPTTLPMYMPSYLPRPQMKQPSTQSERELLAVQRQELKAGELEVERRTRALNLNAIRDAETRSAAPSVRSNRTCNSQKQAPIKPKRACSQAKPHLKDPFPLKTASPQGSRSPAQ